jgi:hypothetical protein
MTESKLPNLVIAGTVKAGTTSLFRYLASHPQICGSTVKETCYFLPLRYGAERSPIDDYTHHFRHSEGEKYRLESTPGYFDGGTSVAAPIGEVLKDVKVIITLREPVARLRSFLSYQKAQTNLARDLDLVQYIDQCNAIPEQQRCQQDNDAYWGVDGGRYIRYLPAWFDVFGHDRLRILFFDDLVRDQQKMAAEISEWLGIDPDGFEGVRFQRENMTVQYRLAWLQRIAIAANRWAEPVSRRLPRLKRWVRSAYYAINAAAAPPPSSAPDSDSVAMQLYAEDNRALAAFLKKNGYRDLPDWLVAGS